MAVRDSINFRYNTLQTRVENIPVMDPIEGYGETTASLLVAVGN